MSATIELPIPNAETREEIRKLAHRLAMDSIVMQTLERYIIQVLTEVHESRVSPLLKALETIAAHAGQTLISVEHGQPYSIGANAAFNQLAEIAKDAIAVTP